MHHVILSGGLDSSTALSVALQHQDQVQAVGFDYGQRHVRELRSALNVAGYSGVPYRTLSLQGLMSGSSLLSQDQEVPHGHYAADNMAATVVNGRNLLFASAAIAASQPGDHLWFGVHSGDHHIYPDCRPEFWDRLAALAQDAYGTTLHTPFLHLSKAGIVSRAHDLGTPLHLTWSCYEGQDRHCGRCGTCVERAEAFHDAGVADPTVYADTNYWREAVE